MFPSVACGMSWAVGIDIGGTNVRAAQVDSAGSVGCVVAEPVDGERRGGSAFGQLIDMVTELVGKVGDEPPAGIGIGASGPVDPRRGLIKNPYTLPDAYQGCVTQRLADVFGVPVRLENDSDAAALGEAWTGAGAGAPTVVCVTVGTGVGAGVVRSGQIVRGAEGSHPEPGHHVIDPAGPLCYCGASGCVESLASGNAIVAAAVRGGIVPSGSTAADVYAAAATMPECRWIIERSRAVLALAVRNLAVLYAADIIVLAGNALGDPEAVLEAARREVTSYTLGPPGGVRLSLSQLAGMSGCIGAARLVFVPQDVS
jgi:glucokinase